MSMHDVIGSTILILLAVFGLSFTFGVIVICFFKKESEKKVRFLDDFLIIFFHQNKLTTKGLYIQKIVRNIFFFSLVSLIVIILLISVFETS